MLGYYFITDATLSRAGILSDVKNAVAAGVRVVQYRNKNADTRTLIALCDSTCDVGADEVAFDDVVGSGHDDPMAIDSTRGVVRKTINRQAPYYGIVRVNSQADCSSYASWEP